MPPKSILKSKKQAPSSSDSVLHISGKSGTSITEKHRQTAIHHAQLLQQRKDIETANLAAMEELMEFPTDSSTDAAYPHQGDVIRFEQLITLFQPSDYDELFTERNCMDKCGYVFCPRPRRQYPDRGVVHLAAGGKHNTKFLSAKHVEIWCSDACARRALYTKVQMNEQPAWERIGGHAQRIELLDETGQATLQQKLGQHKVGDADDNQRLGEAIEALALERGEQRSSSKPNEVMTNSVEESNPLHNVEASKITPHAVSRVPPASIT